ncbi:MAG: hypothetical protein IPM36_23570 [Lewinellaceae bacterium]|nr:hypothetical protein [Lewinellaceae bacterium]
MRGYGYIGCLILCLSTGLARGQGWDGVPKLYPSNLTAYDLEEGLPISCVSSGLTDRRGRLWVNACFEQPEHRTVSFFRFDGRHSEVVHWDSLPPGAENLQPALSCINQAGDLFGFFRLGAHFFLFDPETHRTVFYRLTNPDAEICWMDYSAQHGLILLARLTRSIQVYRFRDAKTELLADLPIVPSDKDETIKSVPFLPGFQTLAGDELWFFQEPITSYSPENVREQFLLIRLNLRTRELKSFTYDALFSATPEPREAPWRQFVLCSDARNHVLLLDTKRLYEIEKGTGRAVLKTVFDNQVQPSYMVSEKYRAQKDELGNLLFVLPDERKYYRAVLLDTAGQYFDYTAVLQQMASVSRFGWIHQHNVQSNDFRRSIKTFSAGGLIVADIQFYGAISYIMKGIPTRAIAEWRPGEYLVRSEMHNGQLLVRPHGDPNLQLFHPELKTDNALHHTTLSNLIHSDNGFWWYGAPRGLVRIDSNKLRTFFPVGFDFTRFTLLDAYNAALVDNRGQLFFYNLATRKSRPWKANGKPVSIQGEINELFLSKDSTLWIATLQGLWQFSLKSGNSRRIGLPEGFRDERIMCISEDARGRLWVGTYGAGVHIFHPQTGVIKVVNVEKGLSNNTVVGILADAEEYYWLSTYKGINLLSPEGEVLARLSEADGLSTNEFNRYSYYKDSKGRLIFGSIHGINILEPELLKALLLNANGLNLFLTEVNYWDERTGADRNLHYGFQIWGTLELPATHRYLNLGFALSNLVRPENQTFFYRIEGFSHDQSDDWIFLGDKPRLSLPDLPPGDLRILIRGADYRGNQAEAPIVLNVHVGRFFYEEPWFYLLCFLLVASGAAYWIYRERLLRKNLERELAARTHEIMDTRDQLIAQEKLASLGQMVAGIAHEIKNPLNFVNNFSEGSEELLEELREELERYRAKPDDAAFENILAILEDLRLNAVDIVTYGNQADRIVKSMMDHARGTSGQRLSTDINKLVEDNLNLAYHGFRAIHPAFQAHLEKVPDPALTPLEVYPQELGRVLLNILNNACFAVNEKQKSVGGEYHPTIRVSTGIEDGDVVIRIRDNGPGIQPEVREQIFQPFFTTKPTGEGNTGLGLSISYDIITLQHKGKISVKSQPGEFTEFVIRLPLV